MTYRFTNQCVAKAVPVFIAAQRSSPTGHRDSRSTDTTQDRKDNSFSAASGPRMNRNLAVGSAREQPRPTRPNQEWGSPSVADERESRSGSPAYASAGAWRRSAYLHTTGWPGSSSAAQGRGWSFVPTVAGFPSSDANPVDAPAAYATCHAEGSWHDVGVPRESTVRRGGRRAGLRATGRRSARSPGASATGLLPRRRSAPR